MKKDEPARDEQNSPTAFYQATNDSFNQTIEANKPAGPSFKSFVVLLLAEVFSGVLALIYGLSQDDIGGAFFGMGIFTVIIPGTIIVFIVRRSVGYLKK